MPLVTGTSSVFCATPIIGPPSSIRTASLVTPPHHSIRCLIGVPTGTIRFAGLRIAVPVTVTTRSISGTAPVAPDGSTTAPGDAHAQTMRCLDIVEATLRQLGGGLEHVVRTRLYVTDIEQWPAIGRAHAERLGAHPPAATMVEVRRLIAPDMLVEVEVDAFVPSRGLG